VAWYGGGAPQEVGDGGDGAATGAQEVSCGGGAVAWDGGDGPQKVGDEGGRSPAARRR
jgi:hypothetical protein